MKQIVLSVILSWGLTQATLAQQPVGEAESRRMTEEVCAAAAGLQTLQCDFVQLKQLSLLQTTMKAEGRMYYRDGKQLRWEYVTPYAYTFVLDGDKVMVQTGGKTDVVSVSSSRMFQQIARIMLHSVTGRCLADEGDFRVGMYTDGGQWLARLVPRQKELVRLFSHIDLRIDPARRMVTAVELVEPGGDCTRIEMKHVRTNELIADEVFDVQ